MRPSSHHRLTLTTKSLAMSVGILTFVLGRTVVDAQPSQGAPSRGLTLSISTTKSTFGIGDEIRLHMTIANVSESPITIQIADAYSGYQFFVRYDGGPYLTASKHPRGAAVGGGPQHTWLDKGTSCGTTYYAFDSLFDFTKPGTYTVTAVKRIMSPSQEYYTTLTSNVLTINVK